MNELRVCSQCGAAVGNMSRHVIWHPEMTKAMASADLTRDELDDLRDSIMDGETTPGSASLRGASGRVPAQA